MDRVLGKSPLGWGRVAFLIRCVVTPMCLTLQVDLALVAIRLPCKPCATLVAHSTVPWSTITLTLKFPSEMLSQVHSVLLFHTSVSGPPHFRSGLFVTIFGN